MRAGGFAALICRSSAASETASSKRSATVEPTLCDGYHLFEDSSCRSTRAQTDGWKQTLPLDRYQRVSLLARSLESQAVVAKLPLASAKQQMHTQMRPRSKRRQLACSLVRLVSWRFRLFLCEAPFGRDLFVPSDGQRWLESKQARKMTGGEQLCNVLHTKQVVPMASTILA